jgi:hypothetical protein
MPGNLGLYGNVGIEQALPFCLVAVPLVNVPARLIA